LLTDKDLRKELIEKGKKQVTKFSWEKAGKETLEVLEEVANKS
jgi:glycosyltransferase involved in cell wall biosynthesis